MEKDISCTRQAGQLLEGVRILLVVEDRLLREQMGNFFRRRGAEVLESVDGVHALMLFEWHWPDVVVIDDPLPRLPPLDLALAVRRHSAQVPIIMGVDHFNIPASRKEDIAAHLSMPCAFIEKPCMPEEVVDTMVALLGRTAQSAGG